MDGRLRLRRQPALAFADPLGLFPGQDFLRRHWRGLAVGAVAVGAVACAIAAPCAMAAIGAVGALSPELSAATLAGLAGVGALGTALSTVGLAPEETAGAINSEGGCALAAEEKGEPSWLQLSLLSWSALHVCCVPQHADF